jgi:NAD(P)-dependent dehydrogenase (short-subunit alcohol dehydrogenase family)
VILTLSTQGARLSGSGLLGNEVASAAIEAFSRILADELGPSGIRVIFLRPDAIPEAVMTSHTGRCSETSPNESARPSTRCWPDVRPPPRC